MIADTSACMTLRKSSNWLLAIVWFFVSIPLFADPLEAIPPPENRLPGEALAREAQTIIDTVLEHHLDPPTRQEMWLAGTRALLAKVGVTQRPGLSSEISQLTTPAQFAEFTKRLCSDEAVAGSALSGPALEQIFIDGVLSAVPGKAALIPQKEFIVQEQLQGNRYVGTGIALGHDEEKKYPQIATLFPGGPMARAGAQQGDLILKIGDRDARSLSIRDTVDLLRGDEGTVVTLVVGDAVERARTIFVTRGPVVLATLHGLRRIDDSAQPGNHGNTESSIWYVQVGTINGSTVHDLKNVELEIRRRGARAVILDLRQAEGVNLHHVTLLADALLDGGLIGRERTQHGVHEFRADRECLFRGLPVALLVDSTTSKGAEWVASAV